MQFFLPNIERNKVGFFLQKYLELILLFQNIFVPL